MSGEDTHTHTERGERGRNHWQVGEKESERGDRWKTLTANDKLARRNADKEREREIKIGGEREQSNIHLKK